VPPAGRRPAHAAVNGASHSRGRRRFPQAPPGDPSRTGAATGTPSQVATGTRAPLLGVGSASRLGRQETRNARPGGESTPSDRTGDKSSRDELCSWRQGGRSRSRPTDLSRHQSGAADRFRAGALRVPADAEKQGPQIARSRRRTAEDAVSLAAGDERDCRPGLLKTCPCASAGALAGPFADPSRCDPRRATMSRRAAD
jgi:hypothetical protein